MTTRANAYAYIRDIKKIPNLSGSRSFLRSLPRDASPIASLLRPRRDVHTTCRPSTAVTIRDNNAGFGNTIQSECRIGKLSNLCPGIRGFSTPVKANSIADAGLFDEPAQKNETISPSGESIVLPKDGAYLGNEAELRDDTLIKGEYFIFSMLISEKFPDRLEITYNQQDEKSPWECSMSFSFNEGKSLSATGFANVKHKATRKAFMKLYTEARYSSIWEEMQSDPMVRQILKDMLPFIDEGAVNPIELGGEKFDRVGEMNMHKNGILRLGRPKRSSKTRSVWAAELRIPGQPSVKTRFKLGLISQLFLPCRQVARLLLIAELYRNGLWDHLDNALEEVLNPQNASEESHPEKEATSTDNAMSERKVVTMAKSNPEEEVSNSQNASKHEYPSEKEAISTDNAIPHEKAVTTDRSNTEAEARSEEASTAAKKSPSDRGYVRFTADDDLLEMMGLFRNDLLKALKDMKKTKADLGPNKGGRYLPNTSKGSRSYYHRKYHSKRLKKALEKLRESKSPETLDIRSKVADLPIMKYRQQVLDLVNNNPFSIIVADTGSGKSTQVPQMILDDAIDRDVGGDCNILCTQPRRLATSRLAERISQERNEKIGETVGYIVRHARQVSENTHITFCTTGVLLKILQDSIRNVGSFSHIIIDEVHVRDIGIDFVMLLLRNLVRNCQGNGRKAPKITLMSATVDTKLFSDYFSLKGPGGSRIFAPHITIPGRQYPVQHHYLDEILYNIRHSSHASQLKELLQEDETEKFLTKHYALFGETEPEEPVETDSTSASKSPRLVSSEEDIHMPCGLYTATILHILSTTTSGSIVCFLPGLRHIQEVKHRLMLHGTETNLDMSDESRFRIGILHSQLPEEQEKLNLDVPSDCRRIILSTDIAEASVTIPDIKYVVDSGKVNQLLVDQKRNCSRLANCWATQSNAKQRAGRVGRVQPGDYYYIGTKERFDTLRITPTPEMLRGSLLDTCLRAKNFAGNESISSFLEKTIEPPNNDEVLANVESLKQLQALDENENITTLGHLISQLALPPHLAKLVMLGIIFRCLDPLLILASIGVQSSLFIRSTEPNARSLVQASCIEFADGSSSDHISALNAFRAVRKMHHEHGMSKAKEYAKEYMIRFNSYMMVLRTTRHVFDKLQREDIVSREHSRYDDQSQVGGSRLNANSHHTPLIKALLLHCLFPRIAAPKMNPRSWKFATDYDSRSMIHPRSVVMAGCTFKTPPKSLTVYSSKVETTSPDPFIIDNTLVSPLMATMFGGRLTWDKKEMLMDSWLNLDINTERAMADNDGAARSLIELQKAINLCLTTAYDTLSSGVELPKSYRKKIAYMQDRKTLYITLAESVMELLDRDRNTEPVEDLSDVLSLWDDAYFKDEDVDLEHANLNLVDSGVLENPIDE
ncbi:unnamed protein product [Penicillium pancosmium]